MLKSFQIHAYENGTLGLHLTRAPWDPYPWISSIQTDSSAYAAGLRIGDTVLEFNNCDILGLKISEIVLLLKSHWLQDARVKSNTNSNSNDNNSETDNNDNCRHYVTMVIWRNEAQASVVDETHNKDCNAKDEDAENNAHNINQQSLQKFATCLQHIAQLLECPVCLEVFIAHIPM
uniref:PDZ domain-containing protein n=1 Tax=Glossina palpalis gambiensis TaxID=67801 RepID=A0A1B0B724_9MUSC